jgi:hypothetical protein
MGGDLTSGWGIIAAIHYAVVAIGLLIVFGLGFWAGSVFG